MYVCAHAMSPCAHRTCLLFSEALRWHWRLCKPCRASTQSVYWRRPLTSRDHAVQPVDFIGYDVTGGEIEYQILEPMGPGTTHLKVGFTIMLCALHTGKFNNTSRLTAVNYCRTLLFNWPVLAKVLQGVALQAHLLSVAVQLKHAVKKLCQYTSTS